MASLQCDVRPYHWSLSTMWGPACWSKKISKSDRIRQHSIGPNERANVVQTKGFICFEGSSIIEQQPVLFVSDQALICFKSFSIIAAKPLPAFGPMPNYAVADLKTQTCYLSTWGSSATPLSQLMNNQLFTIITIVILLKIRNFMKGLGKQNHHCSISMFNFFPILLLLLNNFWKL